MLKKYNDFVVEKKDLKAEKLSIESKIMKLFTEKPEIKSTGNWPDAKCIYNIANIKKYVGGDPAKVDQVFNDLRKDDKIKFVRVKIDKYNETYPYFYHEKYTSKEEAEKCKDNMEKSQKSVEVKKSIEIPERIIDKKKITKTKSVVRSSEKKKVIGENDLKTKAKVIIRRKK